MSDLTVYQTDKGELKLTPQIVKDYLVSGNGQVTKQEVMMFMALCKYQRLNPFLREAYLVKFGSEPATIITGKEVFTKRASKLPLCNGWNAGVVVINETSEVLKRPGTLVLSNEKLVGGWCTVHRKDWKLSLEIEVSLNEYMRYKKDGTPMASWKSMPATMIRKVAIVQGLRDAFPEDFQGMYSPEEMPIDNTVIDEKPIEVNVITEEQQEQIIDNEGVIENE